MTRDAEIAALKARIEELEGQLASWKLAAAYAIHAFDPLTIPPARERSAWSPAGACRPTELPSARERSPGLPECCFTPSACAGRTSCPRNPACSS